MQLFPSLREDFLDEYKDLSKTAYLIDNYIFLGLNILIQEEVQDKEGADHLFNCFDNLVITQKIKHYFCTVGKGSSALYSGEIYIRMYGLLNACYNQYKTLGTILHILFNENDQKTKDYLTLLKASRIIKCRTIFASHSTNITIKKERKTMRVSYFDKFLCTKDGEHVSCSTEHGKDIKYYYKNMLLSFDELILKLLIKCFDSDKFGCAFSNNSPLETIKSILDKQPNPNNLSIKWPTRKPMPGDMGAKDENGDQIKELPYYQWDT